MHDFPPGKLDQNSVTKETHIYIKCVTPNIMLWIQFCDYRVQRDQMYRKIGLKVSGVSGKVIKKMFEDGEFPDFSGGPPEKNEKSPRKSRGLPLGPTGPDWARFDLKMVTVKSIFIFRLSP